MKPGLSGSNYCDLQHLWQPITGPPAGRDRTGSFYSKISIVVEEADETLFWLELLLEAQIVSKEKLSLLMDEYEEVLKIVNTIRHTRKRK